MLKKITLLLFISLNVINGFGQKKGAKPAPSSDFNTKEAEQALLRVLNKVRIENKLDTIEYHPILGQAAAIQSADMAKNGKAELTNSKRKYKTTAKRVVSVGGTIKTQELVLATSIVKGKGSLSANELADAAFYKWRVGKQNQSVIKNADFVYASPSVTIDESGKKAYISIVFGSFNTFNSGADKKKELAVPYSGKTKKLKEPEDRSCNACKKFKDWEGLASGLYVQDGKIFIKYANLKALSKFIRKSADGLAVDIIQRSQYDNPDYNIVDNNLISKGVLLKTVTMSKLYSKNKIKPVKKEAEQLNQVHWMFN